MNRKVIANQFHIEVISQGWINGPEPDESDPCSHGEIRLAIGGQTITQPGNDYAISTSALLLLRSAFDSHRPSAPVWKHNNRLVLHCGMTLGMFGCPIGINWTVKHEADTTFLSNVQRWDTTREVEIADFPGLSVKLPTAAYRKAVSSFALAAKRPFEGAVKDIGEYQADYEEFWNEFNFLLDLCADPR